MRQPVLMELTLFDQVTSTSIPLLSGDFANTKNEPLSLKQVKLIHLQHGEIWGKLFEENRFAE